MLDERVSFHGGLISGMARRVYDEMQHMDAAAPLAIEGLLLELVASASQLRDHNGTASRPPGWRRRATGFTSSWLPGPA